MTFEALFHHVFEVLQEQNDLNGPLHFNISHYFYHIAKANMYLPSCLYLQSCLFLKFSNKNRPILTKICFHFAVLWCLINLKVIVSSND